MPGRRGCCQGNIVVWRCHWLGDDEAAELLSIDGAYPQEHSNSFHNEITELLSDMLNISSVLTGAKLHPFIHLFKNFYSASSSPLLLRDPDSSTVKKNSFKTTIECIEKRST